MTARYAIYLAPPPDTPLWRFGSMVLGYDAETGLDLPGFAVLPRNAEQWALLTARPRTYGFHATLKAPFRLTEGRGTTRHDLVEALGAFAARQQAFSLGPLAVTSLGPGEHGDNPKGFVALTPMHTSAELAALERQTVSVFDSFRAPPTDQEIAARHPERLTERQRDNLASWGYPFVRDDYRFHMTLTGEVADAADLADALADRMAHDIGSVHMSVDTLVLFEQATPGARFRVTGRFPFLGIDASSD